MSDAKLKAHTQELLRMAKANKTESQAVLCVLGQGATHLRRMRILEQGIITRFGPGWLSDDEAKTAVFDIVRLTMNLNRPEGVFISTPANCYKPSKLMKAMPPGDMLQAAIRRSREGGMDEVRKMVDEGLLIRQDALWGIGQTPLRVCCIVHPVASRAGGGKLLMGEPDIQFFDRPQFGGRMSMFHEDYDTQGAKDLAKILKALKDLDPDLHLKDLDPDGDPTKFKYEA